VNKAEIDKLRELRTNVAQLNSTLATDLKRFLHRSDCVTFRRHPQSESLDDDVGITTTSTGLMALATNFQLEALYGEKKAGECVQRAFALVVDHKWSSSGLGEHNPFTKTVVLRAVGILLSHGKLQNSELRRRHDGKTLAEIAARLGKSLPNNLAINQYPPTTTLGYWFLDAVDRLRFSLSRKAWKEMAKWISTELRRQLSLAQAKQDALMDPVTMAMAACAAARLRKIVSVAGFSGGRELVSVLPTSEELEHAVQLLFKYQGDSGIWPNYYPLFHYPKVGANYCFTFEFLEAILSEFEGASVLEKEAVIQGFEKAVSWCRQNRLEYQSQEELKSYYGWNSGGEIWSLKDGIPESWATGVVHMFLYRLQHALSRVIELHVLKKYGSTTSTKKDSKKWDRLIDAPLQLQLPREPTTVKTVIETRILSHASSIAEHIPLDRELEKARSALLFGPPGTSKTSLVKAISQKLGWPLIELNPSHFLKENLENIFILSTEIFADLMDLRRAVVFFDEMDALAQKRGESLDVTRQLLTTSLLPKIARLYESGRVLFFMATNHVGGLDDAITRAGRFDLLVCVGPPNWEQKLKRLETILDDMKVSEHEMLQTDDIRRLLKQWIVVGSDDELRSILDLFTFDEFKTLLNQIRNGRNLLAALEGLGQMEFQAMVKAWANHIRLREEDRWKVGTLRYEYEEDKLKSRIQY